MSKISEITNLVIKQQKKGLDKLTNDELLILKEYYKKSIPYLQGLSRAAAIFNLEKIENKLEK